MPRHYCCVPLCKARNKRDDVKFITFPITEKLKRKWKLKVGRGPKFNVTRNTRICSRHFVSGRRSYRPENVDFIPSIFPFKAPRKPSLFCPKCRRKSCKCENPAVVDFARTPALPDPNGYTAVNAESAQPAEVEIGTRCSNRNSALKPKPPKIKPKCFLTGCVNNNSLKLRKWEIQDCETHQGLPKMLCKCKRPFSLHSFPPADTEESAATRRIWMEAFKHLTQNIPEGAKVCGNHFVDGKPTPDHPYPERFLRNNYRSFPGSGETLKDAKVCLLCRDKLESETKTDSLHVLWAESCASSLRRLLELDDSLTALLKMAPYCGSCLSLVRSIDFNIKTLEAAQSRLKKSRQKVESLLRNNLRVTRRGNGLTPRKSSISVLNPYDNAVKTICEALPNISLNATKPQKVEFALQQETMHEPVPYVVSVGSGSIPEPIVTESVPTNLPTNEPPVSFQTLFLVPVIDNITSPMTLPIFQIAPATVSTLLKSQPEPQPLDDGISNNRTTAKAKTKLVPTFKEVKPKVPSTKSSPSNAKKRKLTNQ